MPIVVEGKDVELVCDMCSKAYRFKPKSRTNDMKNGSHDTTKPSLCKQCRFANLPEQLKKNLTRSRELSSRHPTLLPKPRGLSRR